MERFWGSADGCAGDCGGPLDRWFLLWIAILLTPVYIIMLYSMFWMLRDKWDEWRYRTGRWDPSAWAREEEV
jgi:hypothetical protein